MVWRGKGDAAPANPPSGGSSGKRPFDASIDHASRVITIHGIRYSFELFEMLGFGEEGAVVRLGKRMDGAITLYRVETAEERVA